MKIGPTFIADEFAEAFRMWAARLIVTAADATQLDIAAREACGYGTSVIGCDAEAAAERMLDESETPDGRPGVALLFFAFNADALRKALPNRTGQSLMTCPTVSVYDGLPDADQRIDLGKTLRYFGDGYQKSKVLDGQRYWRIPVMDGEFICAETAGTIKAIGGGNLLICGADQMTALTAARRAVDAVALLPGIITPFPGGIVRSGSKVGSRYKALFASTNDEYCPTLRSRVASKIPAEANCVYEIVINGLSEQAVADATRTAVRAACGEGIAAISAGNYGGNLGKFHFHLRDLMKDTDA